MHDFLQSPAFPSGRAPLPVRAPAPDWVQRGIMRSFGEDDVLASYRANALFALRRRRRPRSATPLRLSA